jgi:Protein of unknown function (DUF4232)
MNRRVLAAAAAAGIGVAVAAAPESAGALTPTPTCQGSQLKPHFDGQQGAAGTLYDLWHVSNVGATCHTIGFVGALNFGADGRPLPTTVDWIGAKHTVVLGHNQSAHWRFYFTNPGILGCAPEAAVNMIVTPPNTTFPVLAGRGERSCHGVFNASALGFGV